MKKKIMIDLDDVICKGGFLYLINKFTKKNYIENDFKEYYMQNVIPDESKNSWIDFFSKNNMYEKAEIIDHAFETIQRLSKQYDIYIVTAYVYNDYIPISTNLLKNKFEWLQKNLPFIPVDNYVFTNSKHIINCDIKIDDKISNLSGNAQTKLLFTAYHNKKISDNELKASNIIRVNGWKQIEELLL